MMSLLEADRRLYLLLHSRLRATWLDPLMIWCTKAGTKGILWLGIAGGLLMAATAHGRWIAIATVTALLLAEGLINIVLKPLIRRERPYTRPGLAVLLVRAPGPHSWPSAHAGSSLAAAAVLASAYPTWSPIILAVGLLVGYSRVYVGVHYPLDVIAGDTVGLVCAAAVLLLAPWVETHIPH
jgi:undecaprenyl-diphosphatase